MFLILGFPTRPASAFPVENFRMGAGLSEPEDMVVGYMLFAGERCQEGRPARDIETL